MLVEESYVNKTANHRVGESGLYEPFTNDVKRLFKAFQKEYGRCTGKVYIDTENESKAIGWVFEKKTKYEDVNEYYIQETWITLHEEKPTKTIKHHYHFI